MFEISVATSFVATHAVTISGVDEEPHDHDWKVVVKVQNQTLNSDELIVDFLALQRDLEKVVAPLHHANLNESKEIAGHNPTAEYVAFYIATQLQDKIPPPVRLSSVHITEAPNCIATYQL